MEMSEDGDTQKVFQLVIMSGEQNTPLKRRTEGG
jgi:hypothetical protein